MLGGGLMGKKNGIRILDYWTKDNPSNTCPRPQFNATVPNMSVLGVQKASYFRLRSVTLGYTFPSKMLQKVFIKNARLYFVATNLFTSTEFKAFTPEVVPGGSNDIVCPQRGIGESDGYQPVQANRAKPLTHIQNAANTGGKRADRPVARK